MWLGILWNIDVVLSNLLGYMYITDQTFLAQQQHLKWLCVNSFLTRFFLNDFFSMLIHAMDT